MKVYAYSQKGINKSQNEDRIIVGKTIIADGSYSCSIESGVIAVADGVGGNNAGYVASHFVANKITQLNNISDELFTDINNELIVLSQTKKEYNGMATTLSGISIADDSTDVFNVGNSRVYLLQSGKYLKQITKDDTTLNFLIETRQISEQEAKNFNRKNEITSCFGGGNANIFRIKCSKLPQLNSSVLITSDGIHDHLTIDQMEDIIAESGLNNEMCVKMAEEARKCGSNDDISIVIGEI